MVSFTSSKKDLLKTLKPIKAVLSGKNKKNLSVTCEITIKDNKVIFTIPGSSFELECQTEGTVKASIGFLYFFEIINKNIQDVIKFEFGDGFIKCGLVKFKAHTWYFEDDSILRSVDLPLNYKDIDLLRMKYEGYTYEELEFNKLIHKIENAEENLKENLLKAYIILKDYGVKYEELEKIIKEKINNK